MEHIDRNPTKPKRPRQRLRIEALLDLVGPERTLRLCQEYGGMTLPTLDRLYRRLRREAVISERHTQGTPVGELAAKYNLQPAYVRRIITEDRRQQRDMRKDCKRLEAAQLRRAAS